MKPKYVYINTAIVLHDAFTPAKKYEVVKVEDVPESERNHKDINRKYLVRDDAGEIVGVFASNCTPAD